VGIVCSTRLLNFNNVMRLGLLTLAVAVAVASARTIDLTIKKIASGSVGLLLLEGFEGGRATLMVKQVMPGSPAERAGLKLGDILLVSDGVNVRGMNLHRFAGCCNFNRAPPVFTLQVERKAADEKHYRTLGLRGSDEPGSREVKAAYHSMALRWHPDKHPSRVVEAQRRFQAIADAFRSIADVMGIQDETQLLVPVELWTKPGSNDAGTAALGFELAEEHGEAMCYYHDKKTAAMTGCGSTHVLVAPTQRGVEAGLRDQDVVTTVSGAKTVGLSVPEVRATTKTAVRPYSINH
jgi:hypothetical protein